MTYEQDQAGRVAVQASNDGRDGFLSHAEAEERLVEAMLLWRRAPDRERSWLHVKAYWPDIRRSDIIRIDPGGELDWPSDEHDLRPLPLSRADVAQMTEASEWMRHVPERDRRLVALAVTSLANGAKQVPWLKLKRAMGVPFGAEGLRKRYSRAIAAICNAENSQLSAKMSGQPS